MKRIDALGAALAAVAARPERPATATLHDSPDARLIVFRLEPGQVVTPHTSTSSVLLVGLEGAGMVSGAAGEESIAAGEVVSYEPNELHGMRAGADRLVLLAVITPRPGTR
ncbi:MAG: cupin domain-containing protein [Gemmatimonadetes bacterium]|nr:cupin domain-containing protein [Gemmatimonadota bacterium]MBI3569242.1 cupin domain-containing protein [Gemmatimonadota bacterium]